MMDWSEDNFLERLMPYLKSGDQAGAGTCPDPETLTAFAEGTLASKKRNAVQIHVDECCTCAQVCQRLKDFSTSSVAVSEAEWQNAEKRLDNWMHGFLRAGSTRTTRSNRVQPIHSWWKPKNWLPTPTLGYALAATLGVALVVGMVVSGLGTQKGRSQLASAGHQSTAASSETAQTETNPMPSETQRKAGEQQPATTKPSPTASVAPAAIAHSAMPKKYPLQNDIVPLKGEPQQSPLSAIPAQISNSDLGSSTLTEIRIQAGTGMLLRVESVSSQSNRRFVFQGHLVQPLVQDGRTVLPTNTLIVGAGMVSGGPTSIWVNEIQSSDVPTGALTPQQNRGYALKATGAQPNVRFSSPLPGGRLVPGETLEARFVTSSIYLHEATLSPRVWEVPKQR